MLGIPTVSDRIVLQSVKSVIEPRLEATMLPCSHAYRANRGSHTAMDDCRAALQAGRTWVIETDIRNFFDSISHWIVDSIRGRSFAIVFRREIGQRWTW